MENELRNMAVRIRDLLDNSKIDPDKIYEAVDALEELAKEVEKFGE